MILLTIFSTRVDYNLSIQFNTKYEKKHLKHDTYCKINIIIFFSHYTKKKKYNLPFSKEFFFEIIHVTQLKK